MGKHRLQAIRRKLTGQGYENDTIDALFQAWAPSTLANYESYWCRFEAFCANKGKDPADADYVTLDAWTTQLIGNGLKRGAVDIAKCAVTTAWDLIQSPSAVSAKLSDSAAKINGDKSKGIADVWDLAYLHDYIHDIPFEDMSLQDLTVNVIIKLKATTGWRSSDLRGIYISEGHSLRVVTSPGDDGVILGVYLRFFDGKVSKGQWSRSTFLPRLGERFAMLCAVRPLLRLRDMVLALGEKVQKISMTKSADSEVAVPLFIKSTV